ncbi:hypothetical protein [Bacillus wiedmannii]|uniref:hypothetical protein n=1 Tax=Bacillus wiedmannii TaxID=1890302 RepID=UPI003D9A055E
MQQKVMNKRENPCGDRDFIGEILLLYGVEIWRIRRINIITEFQEIVMVGVSKVCTTFI